MVEGPLQNIATAKIKLVGQLLFPLNPGNTKQGHILTKLIPHIQIYKWGPRDGRDTMFLCLFL